MKINDDSYYKLVEILKKSKIKRRKLIERLRCSERKIRKLKRDKVKIDSKDQKHISEAQNFLRQAIRDSR